MKFHFHASKKNLRSKIFFANLHLYHFVSFSWARQMFQVRHFACLVPAQAPRQLLIFLVVASCLAVSASSIRRINHVMLHLFHCDWLLFRMLYPLLSILIDIFLTNRLYRSRIDLEVTLKKGFSNEFKIAAILYHACPFSTLPQRCIQAKV